MVIKEGSDRERELSKLKRLFSRDDDTVFYGEEVLRNQFKFDKQDNGEYKKVNLPDAMRFVRYRRSDKANSKMYGFIITNHIDIFEDKVVWEVSGSKTNSATITKEERDKLIKYLRDHNRSSIEY